MPLRILRDESGATAVEFALISVPFLALILFCLQVAIVFFAEQGIQTFNDDISRNVLTGATQKAGLTQSQFKAAVCAQLPSLYTCSRLLVDVQSVDAFSSATTTMPTITFDGAGNVTNAWQYNLGSAGSIVVIRMMYLWPVVGTILGPGLANESNGDRLIMSTAVFKNEQY